MSESEAADAVWPALANLNSQQEDALAEFRVGFRRRKWLLTWLLRFQHLTLGELEHERYAVLGARRPIVGALITSRHRERYLEDHERVPADRASETRRRIVARHLRPACTAAYRKLRKSAVEYLDEQRPSPDLASSTALRPSLDELHGQQRAALEAFVEGFDALEDAEAWAHGLDEAHRGHITDVLEGLGVESFDYELFTGAERRMLLEDSQRPRFAREQVAARFLLPAFNRAVRDLADRAGESPETEAATDHSPESYR